MKKSRWSSEQVVRILSEADKGGKSVEDVCRANGISQATLYNWRRRYRGVSVAEARRLKQLEQENARLKKLLAEREMEIDAMREFLEKKS